jgi:hypothetical protein
LDGHAPGPSTISYRHEEVLYRYLPALEPTALAPAASDPALLDVARGVQYMVVADRAERNDGNDVNAEARRPRNARDRMGNAIMDRCLLLCRSVSDMEMPEVYHAWGSLARGVSERWTMQQTIKAACAQQGNTTGCMVQNRLSRL